MATSFYATQTQKIIICVTATSFYATQTKKKYYYCYGKIIQCNKSFQYLFELHWFVMMRWWLCLTKPIIHQVQVIKKNITKPWAPEKLNNFIFVCRLWGWFRNRITPNHPAGRFSPNLHVLHLSKPHTMTLPVPDAPLFYWLVGLFFCSNQSPAAKLSGPKIKGFLLEVYAGVIIRWNKKDCGRHTGPILHHRQVVFTCCWYSDKKNTRRT